ncbi:topoisomerase DNA-binding C4 zinc finger domain-containing protein [Enterococcus sp. HY326]|uniref:topoisomerase DNA-binding C4 zinc finger domain-containing protein n=1 Tax=Enterococcus sp. HY326 TaxID=2971265 RepID=UPI002240253D|nr:topoisomerase DNA-binding C4 zinc finger domain-containing protein [Enterococcus sp. HY326]
MDWEERKFGRHIYSYSYLPISAVGGLASSAAYLECDCGEMVPISQSGKANRTTCPACKEQYILEGGKFLRVDICPDCQSPLKFINGKYGKFYGCTNFPRCRFTRRMGE